MTSQADAQPAGHQRYPVQAGGDLFSAAIQGAGMSIVVTDPHQAGHPIVFANDAFLELTGYERDEVIGRNCRFLQGPGTDPTSVAAMHQAIVDEHPHFRGDVLNYRKDGTPWWNSLFISPVRDDRGKVTHFFASQLDVTARKEAEAAALRRSDDLEAEVRRRTAELQRTVDDLEASFEVRTELLHEVDHRVKNNLQMIASLVQLQARRTPDEGVRQSLRSVAQRVEALSTVHRRLYQGPDALLFDVADFARDLATNLIGGTGRRDIRLDLELEPVEIAKDKAAPLALLVNELVSNALCHAFKEQGGRLTVRVRPGRERVLLEIEDDGVGLPSQGAVEGSFGRIMVDALSRQLQAKVEWAPGRPGTRVTVDLPLTRAGEDGS